MQPHTYYNYQLHACQITAPDIWTLRTLLRVVILYEVKIIISMRYMLSISHAIVATHRLLLVYDIIISCIVFSPQLPSSSLLCPESWSSSATLPSSASPSAGGLLLLCPSSAEVEAAASEYRSCYSTHLLRGCWSQRRWGSSRMACLIISLLRCPMSIGNAPQ